MEGDHEYKFCRVEGLRPEGRPRDSVTRWSRCWARPSSAARASVDAQASNAGRNDADGPHGRRSSGWHLWPQPPTCGSHGRGACGHNLPVPLLDRAAALAGVLTLMSIAACGGGGGAVLTAANTIRIGVDLPLS